MTLNRDQPHRRYRLVEVLADAELQRGPFDWKLVEGWLEFAEKHSPGSPKAILEGDYVVRLPDGSVLKEVSFKTEHESVAESLAEWAASVGRRWGINEDGTVVLSDGNCLAESHVQVTHA